MNIFAVFFKKNSLYVFLMLFFLILFSTVSAIADKVYTFGVVPQFAPRKLASIWNPILEELTKRTGLKFEMVGDRDIPAFEQNFMNEMYDFAYMNPYHAMLVIKEKKYFPLIRDGGRSLYGILVVSINSPIKDVSELNGRKIAFPAPNALGASLLMRADLDQIHKIKFIPVYTRTHSSVYLNVVIGEIDAGGGVAGTFNNQSKEIKNNLRILYKTRPISPHPVTAHKSIPEDIRQKVCKAFLGMGTTIEGKALLAKVPIKMPILANNDEYLVLSDWHLDNYYVKNR